MAAKVISAATVSFIKTGKVAPTVGKHDLPLHHVLASSHGLVLRSDDPSVGRLAIGFGDQAISINLNEEELLDLSKQAKKLARRLIAMKRAK